LNSRSERITYPEGNLKVKKLHFSEIKGRKFSNTHKCKSENNVTKKLFSENLPKQNPQNAKRI